jgi:co-chaperonin GroES (HSP10)
MQNTSGIHPKGHRVLILPDVVEETTESGIIVSVGIELDRERLAQLKGTIVELGNTAWLDQPAPWAAAGDHVIFGKYSGLIYKGADGKEYRIINDLDVVAIVD